MSRRVSRTVVTLGFAMGALIPATGAMAAPAPSENGCNGLFEVARFATFKNGKDTRGHEMVHIQFERHGCAHDHHH